MNFIKAPNLANAKTRKVCLKITFSTSHTKASNNHTMASKQSYKISGPNREQQMEIVAGPRSMSITLKFSGT